MIKFVENSQMKTKHSHQTVTKVVEVCVRNSPLYFNLPLCYYFKFVLKVERFIFMDHIYPTKDYKVYKIKDEIAKLSTSVLSSGMPKNIEDIALKAETPQENLKKFSIELFQSCEDYGEAESVESASDLVLQFTEEALELNCVKMLRELNCSFKENRVNDIGRFIKKDPEIIECQKNLVAFTDSVITLRFYEPYKYTPCIKNQPRFHQEYQVLGSCFLTSLRDKFYCQCNFGPFFDISDDPHSIPNYENDNPDSGFFFIHDTFYNDTRNPKNLDYAEVILKWFRRFHYVRDFKTAVMQDTKFEDLEIRIGYPCVYQHHGACEHLFCITSVDLIDHTNSLVSSDYPILMSSGRKRSTLCDTCSETDAAVLVTKCALHVKDPMKVCESCFFSFHYGKDGSKICEFSAYRIYSVRPEPKRC